MPTVRLYPISDISIGNWTTESSGVTNLFQSIDEAILNDIDWIFTGNTTSSSCSFGWTQASFSGTITDVIFYMQAGTLAGDVTMYMDIPDNGHQTAKDITATDTLFHVHNIVNPHTGNPWTLSEINALPAGFTGAKVTYIPIVYQTYIDVVYTEAAGGVYIPQVIIIQ